jgi:hypothetical protein
VDLVASYITAAPEDLLNAVARVVADATESRAQFEAEPTAFRWIFYREGEDVWVRILGPRGGSYHESKGTEIWSCQLSVATPSRNGSVAVWLPRWNATSDG